MSPSPETTDAIGHRVGTLLVWTLLWALALFTFVRMISAVPLVDPDEGRNAEVAREMAESGDFIVPHLNGLPYLDKPVLLFAASALSIRVLGAHEVAARLPALLFTLGTVGLVTAFGWRRFGRETGLVAGMMLASSPIVLSFAGIVIFDAPMMFWVSCATVAFHMALERGHQGWCVAGWAAVGFAVLTKGPVGLVLPLLVGLGEALICRKPVSRLFRPSGFAVFALLVGPWFLAVALRHPEFLHYAFVRETFERFTTDSMRRTGPFYYFLPILFVGAFPWVTLLLTGARGLWTFWKQRAGDEVFLLLWVLLPIIFFSISQSKRPGYILPVIPAVALLGARIIRVSPSSLRYAVWIAAPITAAVGAILLFAADDVAALIRNAPGLTAEVRALAPYLGAGLIGTAGLAFLGLRWRQAGLAGLALAPLVLILGSQSALVSLGEHRSARELAETIQAAVKGPARVIGVGVYPPSLPFYLEDTLLLATNSASEIRSNYIEEYSARLRDARDSTLMPPDWWRGELRNCAPKTVFLLRSRNGSENERETLATALPLLYRNHRYEAYGPCGEGPP